MRILIFAQYFPPETTPTGRRACDLAENLGRRGWDVTVITGRPNHPASRGLGFCREAPRQELAAAGYFIRRVPVYRSSRAGALRRTLNYATFLLSAAWCGLWQRRAEVLVAVSPLPAGLAAWLAQGWRGVPLVFDLQDIWPDSARAVRVMRAGWLLGWLARIERAFYRQCARVVGISGGFRRYLLGLGLPKERLAVIENGVDWQMFDGAVPDCGLRQSLGGEGKFVVGYLGNHGLAQGLETVLDAAEQLRGDPVVFLLAGEGVDKARLQTLARARGLQNVTFVGGMPRAQVSRVLATCDALLLALRKDPLFEITIPSKLYEYMAAGKPIVCSVAGEAAELINSTGCGVEVPPSNAGALAQAVRRLRANPGQAAAMGLAGKACARSRFSRDDLMSAYADLIAQTKAKAVPTVDPRRVEAPVARRAVRFLRARMTR